MIKRIAITGPESTGKTELAKSLAAHYNTVWVPEYARNYIEELKRPYTAEDILQIAKGQLNNEKTLISKANNVLFCDTELIVTKIWCEHKYKFCHPWISENINNHPYDFYLLCNIDLAWKIDKLSEHPHLRKYFFELYKSELASRNFPYAIINGNGKGRLHSGISAVDLFLHNTK